jgi:hypothetical protein
MFSSERNLLLQTPGPIKIAHVLREFSFFGRMIDVDMSANFVLMDPVRLCDHSALPQTCPVSRKYSLTTCNCGLTKN